jgi:hypothetical protein
VAIFDRIRRSRGAAHQDDASFGEPVPEHLLPEINQRVTIAGRGSSTVPSRVEDVGATALQLAFPALELEFGDAATLSWERDDVWFSLETHVTGIDSRAAVPTILVASSGKLSRYDERRRDVRRSIELPIELRVLRARGIRAGRELHTYTVEIGTDAIRFVSSAPFVPGDMIEASIRIGEAQDDVVGARVRVIRVDTVPGSWRSSCTVAFDEILRSDRARLIAVADAGGIEAADSAETVDQSVAASEPTTLDGVGGRDEPRSVGDLQGVLEWLRRTEPAPAHEDDPAR